jgi:hypothetical protein
MRLRLVAVGEWILVLPAASLLAALAVRRLQPREHEPARTLWRITEWAASRISPLGAALLFLALPGTVAGAIFVATLVHIITD